ncbi:MAG: winged helix-turn-helix domain-containing protein [archaeon]|nr:winged helix-turn-helix domain-containing protein [archaeon]
MTTAPKVHTSESNAQHYLKGNTMKVYLYLLKHERSGVREIGRALNLSSATLAQYHLRKLESLGIAKSEDGAYWVDKEVAVDALQSFAKIGTRMVPRFLFYAVMFTILSGFLLVRVFTVSFSSYLYGTAIDGLLIVAVAVFWYETVAAWRHLP